MGTADFVQHILQELGQRAGNLTAVEAAWLAHRSPSRVRHVFTPIIGMSFRTARLHAKLHRGSVLLATTHLNITEISATLGYSDRTKFEKAFKRLYGVTPTEYRQRIIP